MLGDRRDRRRHPGRGRVADGRHPVEPLLLGQPTEAVGDVLQPLDQMRLLLTFDEHHPPPSRARSPPRPRERCALPLGRVTHCNSC